MRLLLLLRGDGDGGEGVELLSAREPRAGGVVSPEVKAGGHDAAEVEAGGDDAAELEAVEPLLSSALDCRRDR